MADCAGISVIFKPRCWVSGAAESVAGGILDTVANAISEAVGKAVASLGTAWLHVATPDLTGTGGTSLIAAGTSAPHSANLTTVLGYVSWVCASVAVLSLFALGGLIAARMRAGEGLAAVGRLGLILGAVVLISGASALVAGVLPAAPSGTAGAVLFLQSSLWWYMGIAAVAAVVIGGARMCWEQRADPGKDVVKGLLTLIVVAGTGVTIVGLLVTAADAFSVWVINGALQCDVATDAACFGRNISAILGVAAPTGLGVFMLIVLGLFGLFTSLVQIVLMIARGGMLVILAGILPLSASFTSTETGKTWFRKCVAWTVAFILYKPAAAIVYAAAFQLAGTRPDDGSGLLPVLTGLLLMVLALFAMPALLRFVTPMVGGLASGAGGAAGGAALAGALPSGAAALGRLATGRGGGGSSPGGDSDTSGSTSPAGSPSGSATGDTGSGGGPKPGGDQQPGTGQPAGADAAGGSGTGSATSTSTSTGAGAGAAAGPVGAAAEVGVHAARAGAAAVRGVGEHATGDNSN